MLIVLNIVIIIFVIGMAALWATYGFFSGFLQLITIIASGVIALALWEPVSFWLLGRMPAYAHGVGLLAPFALCIILLRIPLDKFCKMNLNLPHLADQIGGGICGALAGIIAFGMLLNGANFLPIERGALGWEPLAIQGTDVTPNDDGQLWSFVRVDAWSAGFFEFLSAGAMSPTGGTSLAEARPDLSHRAKLYRVPIDTNQMKSAHPDSVQVAGVYAVPATAQGVRAMVERSVLISFLKPSYKIDLAKANFGESGLGLVNAIKQDLANRYEDQETHGRPSDVLNIALILEANRLLELELPNPTARGNFDPFLAAVTDKLFDSMMKNDAGEDNAFANMLGEGKSLFIVDTMWNSTQPGTYNTDDKLRVAISQIQLQVKSGDKTKMAAPVGYSIEYSQNTKGRIFQEIVSSQHYIAYAPYPEFHMGWAFILPAGEEPVRFFARELRFDLTELPTPQGQESPVNNNIGATAVVMGAPRLPSPKDETQDGGENQPVSEGAVAIGSTGSYAEINESLPRTFGGATSTSLEPDKSTEPWTLREGKDDRVQPGRGGRKSTIRAIWVAPDSRLVRIQLNSSQASSLYGKAIGAVRELNTMSVKDEGGNAYPGIGYVLHRSSDILEIDIRADAAQGGLRASELPTIGPDDTLYVYFQVPVGQKIVAYALGNDEEQFEKPLEVTEKKR